MSASRFGKGKKDILICGGYDGAELSGAERHSWEGRR